MRKSLVALALSLCMVLACSGIVYGQGIGIPNHQRQSSDKNYVEGEAVVLFSSDVELSAKEAEAILDDASMDVSVNDIYRIDTEQKDITDTIAVVSSDDVSTAKLVKELSKLDGVEIAEPNYIVRALNNGKYFGSQWHLANTGQNAGTAGEDINYAGRPAATGGDKVVAVIDTGVDYTHPDLKDVMWTNNGIGNLIGEYGINTSGSGKNDDPKDNNGHGTHCAGIIAAQGVGTNGVTSDVKIMALKFLDSEGSGDTAGAIACYEYISKAIDAGVNVVAVNDSWASEEESRILDRMITKVGEKGCVSVVAAGNEGMDYNTEESYMEYPACFDNPYMITVAATDEKGEVAEFSCRGSQYVDVAAPGTTILSTVSDYVYNPTLYGDYDSEEQQKKSVKFNNFNDDTECELNADFEPAFTDADVSEGVTVSRSNERFMGAEGSSLKFECNAKSGEYFTCRVPYTVGDKNDQYASIALAYNAPASNGGFFAEDSYFILVDVPKGTKVDPENAMEYGMSGYYTVGKSAGWDVINLPLNAEVKGKPGDEREIVLLQACENAGKHEIYIDNLGVSNTEVKEEEFGKYDFMSGTSMATPVVAGVLASVTEGKSSGERSVETIQKTLKLTNTHEGFEDAVLTGGIVKYGCDIEVPYSTLISKITVDTGKKQIKISGYGFDKDDLKVEIQRDMQSFQDDQSKPYEEAEIIKRDDKTIIIKDNNWINRYVKVRITAEGRETSKDYIYLIDGKKKLKSSDAMLDTEVSAYTTDGRKIYSISNSDGKVSSVNIPAALKEANELKESPEDMSVLETDEIATVEIEKIFGKKNGDSGYKLRTENGMSIIDGNLYAMISLEEVYPADSNNVVSKETKLVKINASTGKVTSLGKLPADVASRIDVSMGSYNGRLYFAGGYDRKAKEMTKTVNCYDPSTKKWTTAANMPEARGGGKLLQSGKHMLYILGYDETEVPYNLENYEYTMPKVLIYNGKTWKESKAKLDMYYDSDTEFINRGGITRANYTETIAQCADGILFYAEDSKGYGNMFRYSVSKDKFIDTGYQFEDPLEDSESGDIFADDPDDSDEEETMPAVTAVIGDKVYYLAGIKMLTGSISGPMVTVSSSDKLGTVSGTGKYMPGQLAKLTARGKAGYYCKAIAAGNTKVSRNSVTVRVTGNTKVTGTYSKFNIKVRKKMTVKAGKKKRIKVRYSAKAARAQKPVRFISCNKKYATVNKKGVIKAKKAGKGKTVKIKVKADKKVVKTIKVKIK